MFKKVLKQTLSQRKKRSRLKCSLKDKVDKTMIAKNQNLKMCVSRNEQKLGTKGSDNCKKFVIFINKHQSVSLQFVLAVSFLHIFYFTVFANLFFHGFLRFLSFHFVKDCFQIYKHCTYVFRLFLNFIFVLFQLKQFKCIYCL